MVRGLDFIALRPIALSDADDIQRYASDVKLAATCNVPHPYPPGAGKRWAEKGVADRAARTRFPSVIVVDGRFSGLIGINRVDFTAGTAELDYWLARPFWGRGIATAAVGRALALAFDDLGLKRIFSGCLTANAASVRVLEKNGLVEIAPVAADEHYGCKFVGETIRRFTLSAAEWRANVSCTQDGEINRPPFEA